MLWLSIHCCESTACSLKGGILSARVIAPSSSSLLLPGTLRTCYQSFSCPKSLLEKHHHLPHTGPGPNSLRAGFYGQSEILSLSTAVALVKYLLYHLFFGLVVPRELMLMQTLSVSNYSVMCLLHAHLCPKRKMLHLKYHRYLKKVIVCLSKMVFDILWTYLNMENLHL